MAFLGSRSLQSVRRVGPSSLAAGAALALVLACGTSGPTHPGDKPAMTNAKVTLSPVNATVVAGQTQPFTCSSPWGGGATYAVLPATGGSFDGAGTFTASSTPGNYRVVAFWNDDVRYTASTTVTVAPAGPQPAIISFTGNPATITQGQGTLLAFSFVNGTGSIDQSVGSVESGGSVPVSPAATTTYTLTVTGSGGTTVTAQVTVNVKRFVSKWLYVADDDGHVSSFNVDDNTGLLTSVGPDVPLSSSPSTGRAICADAQARFVFATDPNSNTVTAFTINQSTGALTMAPNSPVTTDSSPWGVAVDPAGLHLYVRCDGVVDAYGIDGTNGDLTAIGSYPTVNGPYQGSDDGGIAVHPAGTYLFTAGQYFNKLDVYAVDPASGALSGDQAYAILGSTGPIGVAVNPTGAFVAVKGEVSPSYVTTYSFDISTGTLSNPIQSSALAGYNAYNGLCFSPTLSVLYTAFYNALPQTVGAFGINLSTGVLTPLAGSPYTWFSPTNGSDNVMVSRNGKWAYATNYGYNNIAFAPVDTTTGALASSATIYGTGTDPDDIAIAGVLVDVP